MIIAIINGDEDTSVPGFFKLLPKNSLNIEVF